MNQYSSAWFDTFLSASRPPPVQRELAFFERHLPLPEYRRVLDVACGIGRHARALSAIGHEVLGVDVSEDMIAAAREDAPDGATFVVGDMRSLDGLASDFDAVVCLWQSFGNFTEARNREVLAGMSRRLRPGGRLLLDLYNREALPSLPTEDVETRDGREFATTRELDGGRFRVRIEYSDRVLVDELEWEVFTPGEIVAVGESIGLTPIITCAWFDDAIAASADHVRMQVLFARP